MKGLVLGILFQILVAGTAAQTAYYVDPSGLDDNTGTSPSSPWRTIAKINSRSFTPGDKILFRSGGVWNESLTLTSSAGGANGLPITLDAYDTGPRPVITGLTPAPGWNTPSNWTRDGTSDRWSIPFGHDPFRVVLSGVEYGTAQPSSQGGSDEASITSQWRWFWNQSSGRLFVYSPNGTNPANFYTNIQTARGQFDLTVGIRGKSYLVFRNLNIQGGITSMDIYASNGLLIENCDIGAFAGHYGMWIDDHSQNGVIRNCNVDRKDAIMYTWQDTYGEHTIGGGDCISLRNGTSYWEIHHNVIRGFGHDGVAVGAQYTNGDDCVGNLIHNNEFRCDNDYGRALNFHGVMRAVRNKFYCNYIHNVTENGHIQGLANEVFYNLIDTVTMHNWGTYAYQSAGLTLDDFETAGTKDSNKVYNNTIRNVAGPGIQICSGNMHALVENNIVENTGTVTSSTDYVHNIGIALWATVSNATVRNNIIYNGGQDPIVYHCDVYVGGGCGRISVAALNGLNGSSGNILTGNMGVDPLLQPNLRIPSNSPAKDAALNIGATFDYAGTPVPYNDVPDIGAFEWVPTLGGGPPDAPVLQAPPNGATGLSGTITFSWLGVTGASSYRLQVATDPQFGTIVFDTNLTTTSMQIASLAPSQTFYWHVRASSASGPGSFSPTWSLTTVNLPIGSGGVDITAAGIPVALVMSPLGSGSKSIETIRDGMYPPAGGTDPALQYDTWNAQNKAFDWTGYTFPAPRTFVRVIFQEGIRYSTGGGWFKQLSLQVFSGGQWSDIPSVSSNPPYPTSGGTSFSIYELTFPPVTGTGIRVAGVPAGVATYISVAELRVFEGGLSNALTSPVGLSPQLNAVIPATGVTFRWSSVPGAGNYHLQLSNDVGLSTLLYNDSTLTDTVRTFATLSPATGYYWRIRARNPALSSPFSSVRFFSTADTNRGPILIANLVSPKDGTTVPQTDLVLSWTGPPGVEEYQIQVTDNSSFSQLLIDTTTTGTTVVIRGLIGGVQMFWRVLARAGTGPSSPSTIWKFRVQGLVSSNLDQNYPNPFNPSTMILYRLDKDAFVDLRVFNVLGQVVATLVNGFQQKGPHRVRFDAFQGGPRSFSLASGVYFCQLTAGDYIEVRKMILRK